MTESIGCFIAVLIIDTIIYAGYSLAAVPVFGVPPMTWFQTVVLCNGLAMLAKLIGQGLKGWD